MFSNVTTGSKILLGFGLSIVIMLTVGYFGYRGISTESEVIQKVELRRWSASAQASRPLYV